MKISPFLSKLYSLPKLARFFETQCSSPKRHAETFGCSLWRTHTMHKWHFLI